MRYIKVLSMFVILVVALLLISTIRTYAGNPGVLIIDCDGNQVISKSTESENTPYDCDISGDCGVGDSCVDCIATCLAIDCIPDDEPATTGAGGKTRVFIVCPD